ncbi:ABC transporter ATP-binding protein [uncultured Ferrovibrio sp.]|jgi:NitT/TauT family transport system ATP-binding protein|uniref:ABC transporter ATP-binding protein n=1 Tax=uncultured Ferrovibrio sp. TaxID=1576913 RepID=UPI002617A41E|nr:ABC transporter ATP-binding protein [uncultured Ferrovibrio sp.]
MQVVLEGVGYRYGDLPVLDGISFTLPQGETAALIGPSGCGKSTLLNLVGGLLQQQTGRISTIGTPPPGCLNPLTFVFQDFALLPWRSVAGNVALALEHHNLGKAEREARIADVLKLCGLSDFADALPKQLSGGMRQRVGIARAIAVRPAVLLMDEPLSALDAQTRELLMEDLISIWSRERTTTLYVTHNLNEAVRLADKVVVLSRRPGRIKQIVTIDVPVAERQQPQHAATLKRLHDELWALIKAEAQVADREVQNA